MLRITPLALAATLLAAPGVAATFNTLDGLAPKIIAHRGVPASLPENSLPGYTLAMEQGSDLLETDVHLTSDGVVVLMHDDTLTRTTDAETKFPGRSSYRVEDFTSAEIATLNLKTVDGAGVTGFGVPTLADFLDLVVDFNAASGADIGVLVEVKGPPTPDLVEKSAALVVEKGFDTPETGQVQGFNTDNVRGLADADAADPGADLFVAQLGLDDAPTPLGSLIVTDVAFPLTDPPTVLDAELLAVLAGYTDAIAMFHPLLQPELIDEAHALGLDVYGYTFRFEDLDDAMAQMNPFLDAGLDGFITDQPDLALQVLEARASAIPLPGALALLGSAIVLFGAVRQRG